MLRLHEVEMNKETLRQIKWADAELKRSGVDNSRNEAEMLFSYTFSVKREDIYLKPFDSASTESAEKYRHNVQLRAWRYPMQYIFKETDFMGLIFGLDEDLFIPRPETELLVEKISKEIARMNKEQANLFDIGTGCGNIAISLTKSFPECKLLASDISEKALRVATENAYLHRVEKNIRFVRSNLFDNIDAIYYNYFDFIISNPPYIMSREIEMLQPEIFYEDLAAIDGGEDGLYFYQKILAEGVRYLKKGGFFFFEIGYDQSGGIASIVKKNKRLSQPSFYKDYNGYDRIAVIRFLTN